MKYSEVRDCFYSLRPRITRPTTLNIWPLCLRFFSMPYEQMHYFVPTNGFHMAFAFCCKSLSKPCNQKKRKKSSSQTCMWSLHTRRTEDIWCVNTYSTPLSLSTAAVESRERSFVFISIHKPYPLIVSLPLEVLSKPPKGHCCSFGEVSCVVVCDSRGFAGLFLNGVAFRGILLTYGDLRNNMNF